MHAVSGLCLANGRTNQYLIDFKRRLSQEGTEFFLNMHESIRNEYSDNKPVVVTAADMIFHDSMMLDATICLEGHWVPVPKEDTIRDLLEGMDE